jgi:hypothetical protein
MESELRATVPGPDGGPAVDIMVKPDLLALLGSGRWLVGDWKVNGYVATRTVSPVAGYVKRYGNLGRGGLIHDDVVILQSDGLVLDGGSQMLISVPDYGRQLCFGAWLAGVPVGTLFYGGIDSLVGRDTVARYRFPIGRNFQLETWSQLTVFADLLARDLAWDADRVAVLRDADTTTYSWLAAGL